MDQEKRQEIQRFAKEIVAITDAEIDIWNDHHLQLSIVPCSCLTCQKHDLYQHIVEALEKWENRVKRPTPATN